LTIFYRTYYKEIEEAENIRAACEFSQVLRSAVEVDPLPLNHLGETRYRSLDGTYPMANVPLVTDDILNIIKRNDKIIPVKM
jgi:hypothetical protein